MKQGQVLKGSYRLEERLGKSPFAETWAATATEASLLASPDSRLVVKVLSLGDMPDWKGYEHFEREAAALKAMSHPAVPRYVDSFRWEEGEEHFLALAMERVPGRSLAAEAEAGKRWTEAEIESMLADLLGVLAYLHSLRPPIIHRDVNPRNIMLKPNGGLALVDFSGVQDAVRLAYRDTTTMVGTAGYAPIEQVSGRATVRSDLYAAAASAAFLLTRTHPSDLPHKGLRPDPGALVELSPRMRHVLDAYLDPDESRRTLPPLEAAAVLRGEIPVPHAALPTENAGAVRSGNLNPTAGSPIAEAIGRLVSDLAERAGQGVSPEPYFGDEQDAGSPAAREERLPADSRVILNSDPAIFRLVIPRAGLASPGLWAGGGFTVFWLGFVAFWTFSAVSMGAPVFFPMFSLPFWAIGIFMARTLLRPVLCSLDLTMSKEGGLIFEERFIRPKTKAWPLSDVGACRVDNVQVSQRGRRERELVLEVGTKSIRFGRSLSDRERRAISSAVNTWLRKNR